MILGDKNLQGQWEGRVVLPWSTPSLPQFSYSDHHLSFLWQSCLLGVLLLTSFLYHNLRLNITNSACCLMLSTARNPHQHPPAQTAFYFYKTRCQTGFTMEMLNIKVGSIIMSTRWLCEWLFITCVQLSSQALVSPKIATVRKPKCYFVSPDCSSKFWKTALLSVELAKER